MNEQEPLLLQPHLSQYIDSQVIKNTKNNAHWSYRVFNYGVVAMGTIAGIPWIHAAMNAAIILPEIRTYLAIFFAIGTVITVGSDGAWVMNEAAGLFNKSSQLEDFLIDFNKHTWKKTLKFIAIFIFSLLSSTAAIYATVLYNTGKQKYWGILIAFVHLGYGIYGYSKIAEKLHELYLKYRCKNKNALLFKNSLLHTIENEALSNTEFLISSSNNENSSDFFNMLWKLPNNPQMNTQQTSCSNISFSKAIAGTIGLLFPIISSLVSLLLTYRAYQDIYNNAFFYWTMTLISEVPNFVLGIVSTYETTLRVMALLSYTRNERKDFLTQQYPTAIAMISILAAVISLAAPSSGAFITYDTLGKYSQTHGGLQITGTVSVVIARIILANFTMNRLSKGSLLWITQKRKTENISTAAKTYQSLLNLSTIFRQTDPEKLKREISNITPINGV